MIQARQRFPLTDRQPFRRNIVYMDKEPFGGTDMKRIIALTAFMLLLSLSACGQKTSPSQPDLASAAPTPVIAETPTTEPVTVKTQVYAQSGPYGQISLTLPEGWQAKSMPMAEGTDFMGLYGLRLQKPVTPNSYIDVGYHQSFGVCGTGLEQKALMLAGAEGWAGYYDGHDNWDFITLGGDLEGLVAISQIQDEDRKEYTDSLSILDSLQFNPAIKSGGAYYFTEESEAPEIALELELEHITATGADLVFYQWDGSQLKGTLFTNAHFTLEKQEKVTETWQPLDFSWGNDTPSFTAVSFPIQSNERTCLKCEWFDYYGELEPGTYRLTKSITCSTDTSHHKTYELKACFVWEG